MIPKIIHHVWVTDNYYKYPELPRSWEKMNPEYRHLFWYYQEVFKYREKLPDGLSENAKKILGMKDVFFILKSEVLRHEVLRLFGGIYADYDMECLKNFDPLMSEECFVGIEGKDGNIGNSIIAASPGHPIIEDYCKFMQEYILDNKEKCNLKPVQTVGERAAEYQKAFQYATIYPMQYFYPFNCMEPEKRAWRYPASYAKHYWNCKDKGGWMQEHEEFLK